MHTLIPRQAGWPGGEMEPALLAFLKCHITSPLAWDVVRWMAERPGEWSEVDACARGSHRAAPQVRATLDALAADGVLEQTSMDGGASYRLPPGEPTTQVACALVERTLVSPEMRALVAAHLLRCDQARHAA